MFYTSLPQLNNLKCRQGDKNPLFVTKKTGTNIVIISHRQTNLNIN